jgi:GTP-binding protein Era
MATVPDAPAEGNPPDFVSGFVSILGRPNAGKSTLLNALVGAKVAIVSPKPQTTRLSVQAVLHLDHAQIVFLDTPGIHEGGMALHKRMRSAVREALEQRDLLLYLVDATLPFTEEDEKATALVTGHPTPVFLVLNKIDKLRDKSALLPLIDRYRSLAEFREIVPVSGLTAEGLDTLLPAIVSMLPPGPRYFPPGFITDQPERYLAAELIREQVLTLARQEVPHAVAVFVDRWEERKDLVRIAATVVVDREGQKRIVIGSGGSMLKRVGAGARRAIERLLGRRVFLELFVKVRSGWRENADFLNEIDWRYMAGGAS